MRGTRCVIVGSAALMLALVVPLAPRHAWGQDQPPFVFADDDTVTLGPSDLKDGVRVTVLSNSASAVDLNVRMDPLRSSDGQELPGDVLEVTSKLSLEPAGSADMRIALRAGKALPEEGTFSGSLVVWKQSDGPVIRRPVVVESQDTAGLSAPAVQTYTLRAVRWCPIFCPPELINPLLPVTGAAPGAGGDEATLGVVTRAEGGSARVFVDPDNTSAPTSATATSVPAEQSLGPGTLRLGADSWQALRSTGKYQGKIDLLPDQEEAGEVDLTILVTDLILWPLLVIAAGVGTAYLTKRFVGPRRELIDLRRRVHAAHMAFNVADVDFRNEAQDKSYGSYRLRFDEEDGRLIDRINDLTGKPLDENNANYTAVLSKLRTIEATPASWRDFASDLSKLEAAAAVLDRTVQGRQPPPGALPGAPPVPALLTHIHGLLLTADGAPDGAKTLTTVEDFEVRRTQVRAATVVADRWPTLLERAATLRTQVDELQRQLDDAFGKNPNESLRHRLEDQQKQLSEATALLSEAEFELWRAEDADAFTRKAPSADLDRVEQLLARLIPLDLSYRAVVRQIFTADIQDNFAFDMDAAGVVPPWPTGRRSDGVGRTQPAPASQPTEPRQPEPAALERYYARILRRWDLWLSAVALGIALLTGLNTLYFGKTFGTLGDYAAAFLFGAGVNAALQSASSAFELLRLGTRTAARR